MRSMLAVSLVSLALIALFPGGASGERLFTNEVIDDTPFSGLCNYLVIDAMGRPHVAYGDFSGDELRYAVKIGGQWRVEKVPGTAGLLGEELAMGLDSKGQPHIVWWEFANRNVRYAAKLNGTWVQEIVQTAGEVGQALGLAMDVMDRVHVVFFEDASPTNKLWYAVRDGTWGTPELIDDTIDGNRIAWCAVTTDKERRPHVAYRGTSVGQPVLFYAVRNPSWSKILADGAVNGGLICSIALDPMGRPHISHSIEAENDLRHASLVDGAWQQETVDGDGAESYIAVDGGGGIHISYFATVPGNLRYAFKQDSPWATQTVDETGRVGCYTNIDLDSEGTPHIIHYDATNKYLKYATSAVRLISPFGGEVWAGGAEHPVVWEGPGPVDIQLSTDGGFTYETLALGVQSHRHPVTLPSVATTAARVRVVRASPYSSSSSPSPFSIAPDLVAPWWHTLVDSVGATGTSCVLALDAHDNPRIVYLAPSGLRYAARSGDDWYFETIATTGSASSLALQKDGTPHVAYKGGAQDVYYATRSTTSGWTTQAIETANDVGGYTSIAVSDDSVHVAFFDNTNKDLRYATKVIGGSTWRSALVDGVGAQVGFNCALALDRDATAHIVYRDVTNNQLKHAWWTAMGWFQESAYAGAAGTGQSADLAIDEHEALHVSFAVASGESVFYAVKEYGSWRVELVDFGVIGSVVGQTSIALDGDGRPHISYMMDAYELRHAVRLNGGWVIEEVSEPSEPAWDLAYDGQNNSLAIDSQGAARIVYTRYFLDFDPSLRIDYELRYTSSAIELLSPSHASDWPVGARRQVAWEGTGLVDVFLSTDGGFSYGQIADDVRGGQYRLTVPSKPSSECKLRIERAIPHSVSVIDSFFTISSQVELLTFSATPPGDGGRGLELHWSTNPGPADLTGYRIERKVMDGAWRTVVSSIRTDLWIDRDGGVGSSYRLSAINGLGDELMLGEVAYGHTSPLAAWPVPLREGPLSISFATYGGLGGGAGQAEVEIYDLSGRLVRSVTRGPFQAGLQSATWDGADSKGARVSPGVYFVRAASAGQSRTLKIVVGR